VKLGKRQNADHLREVPTHVQGAMFELNTPRLRLGHTPLNANASVSSASRLARERSLFDRPEGDRLLNKS